MTAAMELSRMGIPVRIIDKAKKPSTTSRALAVQTRTIELMELRGLSEKMLEKGNRAQATTIYSGEQILGKVNLNLIPSRYNFCLLLPQSDTEEILRNQFVTGINSGPVESHKGRYSEYRPRRQKHKTFGP